MRFTNKFPYTNINNINLDWIIKRVKELGETVLGYAQDIANAVALAEAAQEAAESVTSTAESAVTTAQAAEATANAIAGTANTALATAQAAETTAQAAEATANAIAGTANTALATAQAAETTAQAANTTAQAAEATADNAEAIAGTASANASNAVQTANTALATAQAANTTAEAAEATAQAAEATAENAETIAGTASTAASNALQTANTALAKAETALDEKAGALIMNATGAVVSFVPDRTIEQNLSVSVDIEPMQAGSGEPSPENVRPISGWDSVEVEAAGVNLFDKAKTTHLYCDGTLSLRENSDMLSVFVELVQGATYTFTQTSVGAFTRYAVCDSLEVRAPFYNPRNGTAPAFITNPQFTFTANRKYLICTIYRASADVGKTFDDFADTCQLTVGSTATDYNPFAGNRYAISLDDIVYGGTLDATAGTLTIDRIMPSLDGATLYRDNGTYKIWAKELEYVSKNSVGGNAISNITTNFGVVSSTALVTKIQFPYGTQRALFASIPSDFDIADVQACYELAAPITIQLDPVQIAVIIGQTNNVWADAGNVTVEFAADLKWYIDSKIAELQALALENGG